MRKTKTAISFGMVNIPVQLKPAVKHHEIGFNMLHKKCGERIRYKKVCESCNEDAPKEEIVKGYEYDAQAYITFEDEELNKIKSSRDNQIEILTFVKLEEIDPVYYEKSYYLEAIGSDKAFILLSEVLNKEKKVAIARTVLGFREAIVAIRFGYNALIMSTLHFQNEIQVEEQDLNKSGITAKELDMATKLVKQMSGKFTPEKYKDTYKEKLEKAINDKLSGKKIVASKAKAAPTIDNLMEALEKSVKSGKK